MFWNNRKSHKKVLHFISFLKSEHASLHEFVNVSRCLNEMVENTRKKRKPWPESSRTREMRLKDATAAADGLPGRYEPTSAAAEGEGVRLSWK